MAKNSVKQYLILARKWRPQTFHEVIGQTHISAALEKAVGGGKVANAYLFSGQRGVGKTSMARIMAKALNCVEGPTPTPCGKCDRCRSITSGSDMDVIEIDGATYTRVDDVRELQEGISHLPYAARFKVYIVDEVHMLSTAAFNAFLKTLEEPPPRVVFVFATTEPEKIPETIKSRCQSYHFEPVTSDDLARHLLHIVDEENVAVAEDEKDEIIAAIVHAAEGSVRDALVTLEQLTVLGDGEIRLDFCRKLLGVVESQVLLDLFNHIREKQTAPLLDLVQNLIRQGHDLERFVRHVLHFVRDLLIIKSGGDAKLTTRSPAQIAELKSLTDNVGYPFLLNMMNTFLRLEEEMKTSGLPRFVLEFHLIKLTAIEPAIDLDALVTNKEMPASTASSTSRATTTTKPAGTSRGSTAGGAEATSDLFSTKEKKDSPTSRAPHTKKPPDTKALADSQPTTATATREMESPPSTLSYIWKTLCESLEHSHMSLQSALQDCVPLELNNATLTIGVVNNKAVAFIYGIVHRNQTIIKDSLQQITGKSYNTRIVKIDQDTAAKHGYQEIPASVEEVDEGAEDDAYNFSGDVMTEQSIPGQGESSRETESPALKEKLLQQIPVSDAAEENKSPDTLMNNNPDLKKTVEKIIDMFDGKISGNNHS